MQFADYVAAAAFLSYLSAVNAWSPTNSYTPGKVECDADVNLIRKADGLAPAEAEWLVKREANTKDALKSFLDRATAKFSDNSLVDSIFSSATPRVGFASCGGGYRAMFVDAGVVAAMDERTVGANENGLGGLLQGIAYISGSSGGSFFTTTVTYNNWTSVQDIINQMKDGDHSIWDLSQSPLNPGGSDTEYTNELFANITESIQLKNEAGFDVSLADAWGLSYGYYFFPSLPRGGYSYQWSDIQDADVFKNGEMPLLIELAKVEKAGETSVDLSSTSIEMSPFEFGSWEPSIKSFTDMKYLGTEVNNGVPTTPGECIAGFDNVNFLTSASTNVINTLYNSGSGMYTSMINSFKSKFLPNVTTVGHIDVNIAAPNPFKGTTNYESDSSIVDNDQLYLVDGGIDGQVIPFTPLMRKERDIDLVIATDTTADTDEVWPFGSALVATYERQFMEIGKTDAFPYVPDIETIQNLGINKNPTFFGCDSSNLTDLAYVPPLVVYLPNRAYSYDTNVSTAVLTYTREQRLGMIRNGFEIATRNNFTDDPDFLGCMGCAVMRRKQEQLDLPWPSECAQCFERYCWNGTISNSDTTSIVSSSSANATSTSTGISSASANSTSEGFSTIHFETSTTIPCDECEQPQPTVMTTTIEEDCSDSATQVATMIECEECEEAEAYRSGSYNHYTTRTSLTTTTEICEECEEAKATSVPSTYSNNGNNNNNEANDFSSGSSGESSNSEGTSNNSASNGSEKSGNSNGSNGSNASAGSNASNKITSSAATILQVTTSAPSSTGVSVVLNENNGASFSVSGMLTVVTILLAGLQFM
ncbi:hypothetical protein DAKH74_045200 [Maudiozyma humilis]|uniref:Lysophospholipase n=1 Tax=Maudiozyma humilis TaxID=51915 RepID=A0AAV5S5A4_MAUHU|nr:hypothetical protein DAKH74_045200 [Kazachstania humilis]